MLKTMAIGLFALPLLAGCDTTDWMADPSDDDYSPSYSSTTSDPSDSPLSYGSMHKHNEEVNRQNCERYSKGANIACNY